MVDNKDRKKNESPLSETKIGRREAIKRIAKGVALVGSFAATTAFFQDDCIPVPNPYYNYSRSYRKYYNYYNYSKYNRSYYNYSRYSRSYYNYSRYNRYSRYYRYYRYTRYYHFIFDV